MWVRVPPPAPKNQGLPQGGLGFLHIGARGLEPEGAWKHAGGMFQPEVACAAAQVESHHRHQKTKASRMGSLGFLHIGVRGLEPESAWKHAGGMFQPEVACAAAQVESHHRHQKTKASAGWEPWFFAYSGDDARVLLGGEAGQKRPALIDHALYGLDLTGCELTELADAADKLFDRYRRGIAAEGKPAVCTLPEREHV